MTTTREKIETAAIRLFAERGFDGTSMRDIAKEVGVSEAALYRHISGKEALGREVFLSRYAALAADLALIIDSPQSFPDRLGQVVTLFCQRFEDDTALFRFLLLSQHRFLTDVPPHEGNVVDTLERMVAAAMAAGDAAPGNSALSAAMMLGVVLQGAVFRLYGRLPTPLPGHAAAITTAALAVLRSPVCSPRSF